MAHVTIPDTSPRVQYQVSGSSTTNFIIPYAYFDETDILVYVDSTLKTLGELQDYTITGDYVDPEEQDASLGFTGGTVVLNTGVTNCVVTIVRDVPVKRETDFNISGPFNITALNTELDKVTAQIQQQEQANQYHLRVDQFDQYTDLTIPVKDDRKGKVLAFDSTTGDPIAGPDSSDVQDLFDNINADLYVRNTGDTLNGDLTITGNLTVQGTTTAIDSASVQTVDLGDDDKIRLGDDNDLQLYHDGTESIIEGDLRLQADTVEIKGDYLSPYSRHFPHLTISKNHPDGSDLGNYTWISEGGGGVIHTDAFRHIFYTNYPSLVKALYIDYDNAVIFYDKNGLEGARFNAETDHTNLGIGTSNPAAPLEIQSDGSLEGAYTAALFTHNGSTGANDSVELQFGFNYGTGTGTARRIPLITASKSNLWTTDSATWDGVLTFSGITDGAAVDVLEVNGSGINVSGTISATGYNNTNWDTAYGWGDHSIAGYLTSYTETDPVFVASEAYNITSIDTGNWNTAYGWGDHSTAGYLTSETSHADVLVDGDFISSGFMITDGAGNYSVDTSTYLTSFDVVDDTSPELGGDLNTNAYQINVGNTVGSKLAITNNGTNSALTSGGTTNLILNAGNYINLEADGYTAATLQGDADSTFYHTGIARLTIQNTGVDVTGDVGGDTLSISGNGTVGGNLTVTGNLQVDGTTTTVNSTTLDVADLNITVAKGAANAAAANGAGLTVDGASATITYNSTDDDWEFNKGLDVTGNIIVSGTVDGVDIQTLNTTAGSALQNVVEDTTPQLGGNLDLNSNSINGYGTIEAWGSTTTQDEVVTSISMIDKANGTGDTGKIVFEAMGRPDSTFNEEYPDLYIKQYVSGTTDALRPRIKLQGSTGYINFYDANGNETFVYNNEGRINSTKQITSEEAFYANNGGGSTVGTLLAGASEVSLGSTSSNDVKFLVGNLEKARLTTNGYLGIGTTTPSSELHVNGDITVDGISKSTANAVTASTASTDIDMTASNFHVITMNANTTFTFSNLANAVTASGTFIIKQDATGGRSFTLPASCKTPVGGATIVQSTGANTTSILSYIVVSSTEVLVNYVGDFA